MTTPSGSQPRSLTAAAAGVLAATLPGRAIIARSALDTMLAADPQRVAGLPVGSRRMVGAAILRSRVYSARAEGIVDLADFEGVWLPRTSGDDLLPDARSLCHSAVAEAYLTSGLVRQGTLHARLASDYADEADNDGCRYRALALLACNLALNGEFTRAEETSARCREIAAANDWVQNTAGLPHLLADMMIAYAWLDATTLESLRDRFAQVPVQGPIWVAFGQLATGWLAMLREDYDAALVAASSASGGADAALLPRLVTGFATGLQAMALVNRGEPGRALNVLSDLESPGDHALCFDLQRATAYLQLGENREALVTTDRCLRMGSRHSLRTLSSILLRRAVASHRLGHVDAADKAFGEAFHIMMAAGAMTPFLGLASEDLDLLLARLVERQPELRQSVADLSRKAAARPKSQPHVPAPRLTPRESVVAQRLRSSLSIADIAAGLHVSPNTLKSQLRSLYAKLGVTTRVEAVDLLERGGFFDRVRLEP